MSAYFALSLAILSIASCFASYQIGRDAMRKEYKDYQERRRRWEEFDDE